MKYTKYPRTRHLPWSRHVTDDDKVMSMEELVKNFNGKEIVVTMKMDGENTSMYNDHIHARSIDSKDHPSRTWVKQFWGNHVKGQLNDNERICGENLYAKHSILYQDLPSYFLGFSFWRDDLCLSWDETLLNFEVLGIKPVPVLYRGQFNYVMLDSVQTKLNPETDEGYVIRLASEFSYEEFGNSVAKYVRPNHVQSSEHWMHQEVVPNKLSS